MAVVFAAAGFAATGFEAILTQADQLEFTLITGSEEFVIKNRVSFLPETELATMFVATEAEDMLPFITQGDIATVRYQMPEELTFTISKAFLNLPCAFKTSSINSRIAPSPPDLLVT